MNNLFSAEFASKLDEKNPLKRIREKFNYPENSKSPVLYFSGNSLGLQPKAVRSILVDCLLYTSPSPRDGLLSRMPSSA